MKLAKAMRRQDRRGQIAVAFVVLIGLILLLTPPMMNLGEVARLKTATANAADAGALAGASWVASGTNYMARVARAMMVNYWIVVSIFAAPFCFYIVLTGFPVLLIAGLVVRNYVFLRQVAHIQMGQAWDRSKAETLLVAIQNTGIDDSSGQVQALVQQHVDELRQTGTTNFPGFFAWDRHGVIDERSRVDIDIERPPDSAEPRLEMGPGFLAYWWWVPGCIFPFCFFVPPGWNSPRGLLGLLRGFGLPMMGGWTAQTAAGPTGALWAQVMATAMLQAPNFGPCGYPVMGWAVDPRGSPTPVRPTTITNSSGTIQVTITRRRQSGAPVGLWTMNYPEVSSTAFAQYSGAHVRPNPFRAGDRAVVDIVGVDDGAGGGGVRGGGGGGGRRPPPL